MTLREPERQKAAVVVAEEIDLREPERVQ